MLSISRRLKTVDQQAQYSLIQTSQLLKQILQSPGHLFEKKLCFSNSQLNSNYFLVPWQFELLKVHRRFILAF